jgi:hypothetical protein
MRCHNKQHHFKDNLVQGVHFLITKAFLVHKNLLLVSVFYHDTGILHPRVVAEFELVMGVQSFNFAVVVEFDSGYSRPNCRVNNQLGKVSKKLCFVCEDTVNSSNRKPARPPWSFPRGVLSLLSKVKKEVVIVRGDVWIGLVKSVPENKGDESSDDDS